MQNCCCCFAFCLLDCFSYRSWFGLFFMHIHKLFFTVVYVLLEGVHFTIKKKNTTTGSDGVEYLSPSYQKPTNNDQDYNSCNNIAKPSLLKKRQGYYCLEILLISVWVDQLSLQVTKSDGQNWQDKGTCEDGGSSIHILTLQH